MDDIPKEYDFALESYNVTPKKQEQPKSRGRPPKNKQAVNWLLYNL